MKILVVRVKGIGNTVLFTPTLAALRKHIPDAHIVFLADEGSAEVVRGSGLVDEIVPFNLGWSLVRKLKVLLGLRGMNFDYSIMTFPANKPQFNILAAIVNAKRRVNHGFKAARFVSLSFFHNVKVPAVEYLHDVDQNLNLLRVFNIPACGKGLHFHVPAEDKEFARDFFKRNGLKKVVAMHPGCDDVAKYRRWPAGHFSRAVELLQEEGYGVLLVAGPGEEHLVDRINSPLKEKAVVLKNAPLKRVAAVVARCSGFLSTDSGIGHVAAAMMVPTLALFGPAGYTRTSPYGSHCAVITKGLHCSPCMRYPFTGLYAHTRCKDVRCLYTITPEEVKEKLLSMVEGS